MLKADVICHCKLGRGSSRKAHLSPLITRQQVQRRLFCGTTPASDCWWITEKRSGKKMSAPRQCIEFRNEEGKNSKKKETRSREAYSRAGWASMARVSPLGVILKALPVTKASIDEVHEVPHFRITCSKGRW